MVVTFVEVITSKHIDKQTPNERKQMVTVEFTETRSGTRDYTVRGTDSGIGSVTMTVTLREGQSWDKEFPKVIAAIMALTGVHDPEFISIIERKAA